MLYPNLANGELTVSWRNVPFSKAFISICDITGRELFTYPLAGNETTISTADLLPGIYMCRINAGQGVVSRKLVVMR